MGELGLELGFALERLKSKLWHRELGYSSIDGYALERCSRSGRWALETAALARRLENLPALTAALVEGRINTSMATLVSSHAEPRTDEFLAAKAECCTVREMRAFLRGWAARNETIEEDTADASDAGTESVAVPWWEQPVGAAGEVGGSGGEASGRAGAVNGNVGAAANDDFAGEHYYCLSDPPGTSPEADAVWAKQLDAEAPFAPPPDEPRRALRVSVGYSDLLVFERSMALLRQLEGHADEDTLIGAALGEADATLTQALSPAEYDCDSAWEREEAEQQEWGARKAEMRDASEQRCEANFRGRCAPRVGGDGGDGVKGGVQAEVAKQLRAEFERARQEIEAAKTPRELDRWIHARSQELSRRDLELGRLWERMQRGAGVRRLRYASPAQYARERVGVCLDALTSRKFLARRVQELPALGEALRARRIGFEAARKIARVATGATVRAWLEQAAERTVKHLREEVDVAERLRRVSDKPGCKPPTEGHMQQLAQVVRALLTGEVEIQTDWPISSQTAAWKRASGAESSACEGWPGGEETGASEMSGGGVGALGGGGCGGGAAACGCAAEHGAGSGKETSASEMSGGRVCSHHDRAECSGRLSGARGRRCSEDKPLPTEWGFVVNENRDAVPRSSLPWLLGLVDDYGRPTAAHSAGASNREGRKTLEQTLASIAAELCVGEPSRRGGKGRERILTLRLRADTYRYWRRLERVARRWLPRGVSFLRFICLCIWNAHRHEVNSKVAYAHIYARDGYRCTSPVCCRRTVQPHHLLKRSQGGGNEDENLTALCCDCHLEGVHQGRIAVEPPASRMLWSIGRDGGLVVLGRKKIRDVPAQEATDEWSGDGVDDEVDAPEQEAARRVAREGQEGGDEAVA